MKGYGFFVLAIVLLVGVIGLLIKLDSGMTGAVFLSEKLCRPGFISMLYYEKSVVDGYTKPTIVCAEGRVVPALRKNFIPGTETVKAYDAFRTDPYRFGAFAQGKKWKATS